MVDNKEFVLKALLQYNYFPSTRPGKEELPPIFTSECFTPEVAQQLIERERQASAKGRGRAGYDQLEYRLTRYNSVSRLLSIPHPVAHAELCVELHKHWDKLDYIFLNKNSQIKPYQHDDGRLVVMAGYGGEIGKSERTIDRSFGKRYVVQTDIANCFPSIYTHAIAWALVGQADAKKGMDDNNEWFNTIDKKFRASRRNETQGVAIGPGSSNIAVEIILGKVDDELRKSFSFIRYIDDYECYCSTEHEALDFVRQLEKQIAKFKLQLNAAKTKILRLPQPVADGWILELGRHTPKKDGAEIKEIFRFLDVAVFLADKNPESSVLKYAGGVINNINISNEANEACLSYLLGLAFHHSDLLPKLKNLIDSLSLGEFGQALDVSGICKKIEEVLKECIHLRRSDGMCWALYLLGRVHHEISEETAKELIETEDALAILTLYWMGDMHKKLVFEYAENILKQGDSYQLDRYWILLYQLYFYGHIKNPYETEKCFEFLKEKNISFMLFKAADEN